MIEVLLVTSLVGIVPISAYLAAEKEARTIDCISNMRNIYIGLQLYESDFERLPDIKFYCEDPKSDPKSLINVLGRYIDDKKVFVCPSMPDQIKNKFLTYIWNDAYNNKFSDMVDTKGSRWLLTEMTAVEPNIPPPHQGSYNVLFLDGHAETLKERVKIAPSPARFSPDKNDTSYLVNSRSRNFSEDASLKKPIKKISMYPRYINL